jgi:hypothetical protein
VFIYLFSINDQRVFLFYYKFLFFFILVIIDLTFVIVLTCIFHECVFLHMSMTIHDIDSSI